MNFKAYAAAALFSSLTATAPSAVSAEVIMNNFNGLTVYMQPSGPLAPALFTLTETKYISSVEVYYFASLLTTTTLELYNVTDNVTVGTYAAPQSNPWPYSYFLATPNVWLGADTYEVRAGNPEAWSWNQDSGYAGFAIVLSEAPVPEPASMALLGLGLAAFGVVRHRR
jgi:hypothetical protein